MRFGLRLSDLREIGWVDAWWLTSEILRDPYSHTVSALRGDLRVPNAVEEAAIAHFDNLRMWRRQRSQVVKASRRPWEGKAPTYDEPVDEIARAARRKRLREFSERRAALLGLN